MNSPSLVQNLFSGPIDIVGDVHGEIDALRSLLRVMGYKSDGVHPEGRRLVFLGDLTDRGPDSPAVVDLVRNLVGDGRAQCVLGNHDLNILLGDKKHDNHWFFGEEWSLDESGVTTPAVLADDGIRNDVISFFKTLPLILERDDVRVVHACWDPPMIQSARQCSDVVEFYRSCVKEIDTQISAKTGLDEIDRALCQQNQNPVKVLTSGRERRIEKPFQSSGKWRYEERIKWWEGYDANELCVFGHYSIYRGETNFDSRAICVDFAVAKRWHERKQPSFDGTFRGCLGALRLPECCVLFDNGDIEHLERP